MEESFLHLIEELRLVRERRARLTERERELLSPRLTDPALNIKTYHSATDAGTNITGVMIKANL